MENVEFKVEQLAEVILREVVTGFTAGEILELSNVSSETREAIRNALRVYKSAPKFYDLIFYENVCEVKLTIEKPDNTFTWKFISSSSLQWEQENRVTSSFENLYGVDDNCDKVTQMIELFESILFLLPAPVHSIHIQSSVFYSQDGNDNIARVISQIGKCKTLRILGDEIQKDGRKTGEPECSRACAILLNSIIVTDEITMRDFTTTEALNLSKISKTPSIEIYLPAATSEQILECAAIHSKIYIPEFDLDSINKFLHLWLQSTSTKIQSLNLKISSPKRNIEKLFEGLKHYGERSPCCDYFTKCKKLSCNNTKMYYMKRTGVNLRRTDGAVAILLYSDALPLFNVLMFVHYPNEKESKDLIFSLDLKTAHLISQYHDAIDELKYIQKRENDNRDWLQKNQLSEQERQHGDATQDRGKVEISLFQWRIYTYQRLIDVVKAETEAVRKTKERAEFGYLALQ